MSVRLFAAVAVLLMVGSVCAAAAPVTIENAGFRLTVECSGDMVLATLDDLQSGMRAADGPFVYSASRQEPEGARGYDGLLDARAMVSGRSLVVQGRLAGLDVEQTFTLPTDRPIMEERVVFATPERTPRWLDRLGIGFVRTAVDEKGRVLPELATDRWVAVPFRHKATDPKGYANDFSIHELLSKPGWEPRFTERMKYSQPPSAKRPSEGWAWLHEGRALCILRFSQQNMLWSVVTQVPNGSAGANAFAFGGASTISGEPAILTRLQPGAQADLGVTRLRLGGRGIRASVPGLPGTPRRARLPVSQGLRPARPLGAAL